MAPPGEKHWSGPVSLETPPQGPSAQGSVCRQAGKTVPITGPPRLLCRPERLTRRGVSLGSQDA